jgi:hypothetical protein
MTDTDRIAALEAEVRALKLSSGKTAADSGGAATTRGAG